jgi:hypothetical protein
MRRQVLKIVGGMALSPWPPPAASAQADRVQQTVAALLAATEEGSILQIDLEDLCDTLKLCGSSPVSFTVTDHDADKVLDACRDALARIPTHNKAAAVVVCSGYGESFGFTIAQRSSGWSSTPWMNRRIWCSAWYRPRAGGRHERHLAGWCTGRLAQR